ncbi:hypothetical protein BASA81_006742 [Batrachochytrium salamandrivorans]|nr:hypothetical protein BASA81_006742 [Batrachochytrium salamandrivorans]
MRSSQDEEAGTNMDEVALEMAFSPSMSSAPPPPLLSSAIAATAELDFDADTGAYFKRAEEPLAATQQRMMRRETASVQFIDPEPSQLLADLALQAAQASVFSTATAATTATTAHHHGNDDDHNVDKEQMLQLQREQWQQANVCEKADLVRLNCLARLKRDFVPESIWLILTLLGGGMSVVAWLVDEITERLFEIRNDIAQLPKLSITALDDEEDYVGQFFASRSSATSAVLYLGWMLFWGLGAVAVVKYVAPQAAGSGIEQVRSIMTGYSIPGYLATNTLIAKTVGLIAVQASGLKIGKEGPFVHIACSLANALLLLPWFKEIRASRALTKQVISAACATGIASTFGSPVGGVLFAIEVTSNVYHTSDYWKAFYTAVLGDLIFRFLSYFGSGRSSQIALFPTTFAALPYTLSEMPSFILLSVLCGLYGGYFVKIILGVRTWRIDTHAKAVRYVTEDNGKPHKSSHALRKSLHDMQMKAAYYLLEPWAWSATVIVLHWACSYLSSQFMKRSLYASIEDFVVSGEMAQVKQLGVSADHRLHSNDWGEPSLLLNLFLYFAVNSFLFALAMSLAVPSGTLIPMLAIGLSMGRWFGEALQILDEGNGYVPGGYVPGGYALVGASAFLAGATGAISTAFVIFETTAQLTFMVPVLTAVIVGRACGKLISPDIYEALQITKNLPNIPPLSRQSSYGILARDLMDTSNIPLLPRYCTLARLDQLLHAPKSFRYEDQVNDDDLFAIVTNEQDRLYMVSVSRVQLEIALLSAGEASAGMEEEERASSLLDVFSALTEHTQMTPACPLLTPAVDMLQMFELSLVATMFVTDNCRVVGWLDLAKIKHRIEHHHL